MLADISVILTGEGKTVKLALNLLVSSLNILAVIGGDCRSLVENI